MRLPILTTGLVSLAITSTASAQNTEIQSLIDRFDAARLEHDLATLAKTLASDYDEISPVGEIGDRKKVLGFYAPELKRTAPAMTNEPLVIRSHGDAAIITTRKSFTIPGGPVRSVRVRYVAERAAGSGQMAVGFGAVHPDPASKSGLILTTKLLAPGSFLKTSSFEKAAIVPPHHPIGNGQTVSQAARFSKRR